MPPDDQSPADRFGWHPEPELLGFGDPTARPALERLGAEAWATALDYLYEHAFVRAMGQPTGYAELREAFFGADRGPASAPDQPTTSAAILEEFRGRLAAHQLSAYHPRSLSYFTPPPLLMSVVGELLAQVTRGATSGTPAVAGVSREEVLRCSASCRYGQDSFGLLTSGASWPILAMALARDVHLAASRFPKPPRGGDWTGPDLHLRSNALLDRPGARRAGFRPKPS